MVEVDYAINSIKGSMRPILFFLLSFTAMHSQIKDLPEIPFNWYGSTMLNRQFKELKIKDKKAIIVTAGKTGMYHSTTQRYLVFYPDGIVRKISTVSNERKSRIKDYPLTSEQQQYYREYLKKVLADKEVLADISKFSYIFKSKEEKQKHTTIVLDGYSDFFEIYQDEKLLHLTSDNSAHFIYKKAAGWEERVKIVELVKSFNEAFAIP